jgi:hypothetical protein
MRRLRGITVRVFLPPTPEVGLSTLLDAVRSFEQRKLHAARHAYRKRSTELRDKRITLPATAVVDH